MRPGKIKEFGIGDEIINLWNQGYSSIKIAKITGSVVSDRSIIRFLNRNGIATHDTRREVVCEECGKKFKKVRNLYKKSNHHFCSLECYWKHLKNPEYNRSVYHMRQARDVVRKCGYILSPEEVVHHDDMDNTNNDPENLTVFASRGDHTRWHRNGFDRSGVIPVWPPGKIEKVKKVLEGEGKLTFEKNHKISGDIDGVKYLKCSHCGGDIKTEKPPKRGLLEGQKSCSKSCYVKLIMENKKVSPKKVIKTVDDIPEKLKSKKQTAKNKKDNPWGSCPECGITNKFCECGK